MFRLYSDNGFSAEDIIPFSDFRLMLDRDGEWVIDKDKGESVVRWADKTLAENPFPEILPASQFKMFQENGNRMIWERPYHQRRARLLVLAFAEKYKDDGKYLDCILDYLWAILEESTWVIPAHPWCVPTARNNKLPIVIKEGVMHGIDLFSATTASTLATVYLLVGEKLDEISPVICEKLKYEIEKRIILPFLQLKFGWTGAFGGKVGNWGPWITSNVLFVTAALEESDGRRKAIAGLAMEYLDNFTSEVSADGGCDEGPHYWTKSAGAYYDAAEILYDMSGGKIDIFGEKLLLDMCEYELKAFIDGDNYLNFADCGPKTKNDATLIRRMGKRLGSERLVKFSETVAKYNFMSLEANHGYRVYKHMLDKTVVGEESFGLTRVWLPGLKVMISREQPETDKGFYLALKGGNNDENHNHNDLGNIIVYYCGKPVFIDAGPGEYNKFTFSDKRYTLWNNQSGYHNTVTLNGVMQLNGKDYRTQNEIYDETTGGASMELSSAYPDEAKVKSLVRSARLSDGRIELRDKVVFDGEGEIDIHFLTHKEPSIEGGRIMLAEGRSLIYDAKLTPKVEKIDAEKPFDERWGTNKLYRIHLKANTVSDEYVNYIE